MHYGAKPTFHDHRDYDFIKTFGSVAPQFPESLQTDANLWMPSQNDYEPIFHNLAMYYGCTDYAQADISTDEDGVLKNPLLLDHITNANAKGGTDIRTSLEAARSLKWINYYFNIRSKNLDFFDSIRLAIISGQPEKRSVSWGCPWFPSWEVAALRGESIMPMPTDAEMNVIYALGWHNSKFAGWELKNGSPMLKNKSYQGTTVGDKGWIYFPREVINVVMSIPGTIAFTVTQSATPPIKLVDSTTLQWLASHANIFAKYFY